MASVFFGMPSKAGGVLQIILGIVPEIRGAIHIFLGMMPENWHSILKQLCHYSKLLYAIQFLE